MRAWDRIISEAFVSNATLDNWGIMLNEWIKENHYLMTLTLTKANLRQGIAFVTSGIGRLYHDRQKHHLTAEALANYATSALMFSFLHCSSEEIDQALKEGHEIIETADMKLFTEQLIQCSMKARKIFS